MISVMMSELTVAAYHPHPNRDPADKAADFVRLVADLSGPMIVCGDFNCVSPEDVIDQASMIAAFRRFSREPEATVDQFIESGRQVFAALRRLGPKDALPPPGRRYSIPTDLISLDKSPGVRIDHVLANDALEIVASEVIHSVATNRASDHHPIMLDFRLRS